MLVMLVMPSRGVDKFVLSQACEVGDKCACPCIRYMMRLGRIGRLHHTKHMTCRNAVTVCLAAILPGAYGRACYFSAKGRCVRNAATPSNFHVTLWPGRHQRASPGSCRLQGVLMLAPARWRRRYVIVGGCTCVRTYWVGGLAHTAIAGIQGTRAHVRQDPSKETWSVIKRATLSMNCRRSGVGQENPNGDMGQPAGPASIARTYSRSAAALQCLWCQLPG